MVAADWRGAGGNVHYRSIDDLNRTIQTSVGLLPRDIDLVVGIPRSGLLAANLISLALNLPLADLDGFLEGRILSAGSTRRRPGFDRAADQFKRVLIVDDSILSGAAMREAREKIARAGQSHRCIFCTVYGPEEDVVDVDFVMERVPRPRVFQWNFMNHKVLERACLDIDGVLCFDPTRDENDDGPNYVEFLTNARPLMVPGRRVAHLVTSRLERYRPETEAWLAARGIEYGKLWMLDVPTAEERRRRGAHGAFKAQVYAGLDAQLFIESEERQAIEIARLSGKPVLSIESHTVIQPDAHLEHAERLRRRASRLRERMSSERHGWRRVAKRVLNRVFGRENVRSWVAKQRVRS
ncbi:phosphoribosyltransferase family protein [Sphingomonas sp. ABOLG]|uniref:phosphoribosyltransferase family protein n=1 Tax=Sphingomonas sp. ABOLG TaxID=1985880 RepID=UPI0019D12E73|nr:phosphoribosyltransferase family protein [Sphingomonas sp. ABOLG]